MKMSFSFRVKMGQREIEISGTKEEVMKNIEELPVNGNVFEGFRVNQE